MEYSPPPLFKQGASARVRVVFFAILAIFLLVLDSRFKTLTLARQVIGTVLYPVQMLASWPRDVLLHGTDYIADVNTLQQENQRLKRRQIEVADQTQQAAQLLSENNHLRRLLDARERSGNKSVLAEVIYDAHDASTRKVIVNRGTRDDVKAGQPVIDDGGVVGQVTRVFPLTAEVTLLTDKNQAIPVQVLRNGLRSVAYGRGQGSNLDMRVTANADVKAGDQLVTSGIDGIYPPGLAVGTIVQVESKANSTFENVLCKPAARIDQYRQLLVLLVDTENTSIPETEDVRAKKEKINRKVTRDNILNAAPVSNPAAPAATNPATSPATGNAPAAAPAQTTQTTETRTTPPKPVVTGNTVSKPRSNEVSP